MSRAVHILRMIARPHIDGARLADLADLTGLPHPSVRRILKCLIDERLVVQDPATRRYQLGSLNYELGLATVHRPPVQDSLRDLLRRLARLTSDSAYLSVRSGVDFICLDRAQGRFPIQTLTQNVGDRRPLGFGAAGTVLLGVLQDDEVERILLANRREIEAHRRLSPEKVRRRIAKARVQGYARSDDATVIGTSSMGMAVPNGEEVPLYAISLGMVTERMDPQRERELAALLSTEIRGALQRAADEEGIRPPRPEAVR